MHTPLDPAYWTTFDGDASSAGCFVREDGMLVKIDCLECGSWV